MCVRVAATALVAWTLVVCPNASTTTGATAIERDTRGGFDVALPAGVLSVTSLAVLADGSVAVAGIADLRELRRVRGADRTVCGDAASRAAMRSSSCSTVPAPHAISSPLAETGRSSTWPSHPHPAAASGPWSRVRRGRLVFGKRRPAVPACATAISQSSCGSAQASTAIQRATVRWWQRGVAGGQRPRRGAGRIGVGGGHGVRGQGRGGGGLAARLGRRLRHLRRPVRGGRRGRCWRPTSAAVSSTTRHRSRCADGDLLVAGASLLARLSDGAGRSSPSTEELARSEPLRPRRSCLSAPRCHGSLARVLDVPGWLQARTARSASPRTATAMPLVVGSTVVGRLLSDARTASRRTRARPAETTASWSSSDRTERSATSRTFGGNACRCRASGVRARGRLAADRRPDDRRRTSGAERQGRRRGGDAAAASGTCRSSRGSTGRTPARGRRSCWPRSPTGLAGATESQLVGPDSRRRVGWRRTPWTPPAA